MNSYRPFYRDHHYPPTIFSPAPYKMPGQLSPGEPLSSLGMMQQPWSPGVPLPLRFRARREGVDWRRFSALDVDRVAREMDVSTLQEYISEVTFCDLEAERCPHCRNPVDPVLFKILRMSQLSTEYLLHCQDYLSSQVMGLEERLRAVLSEREQERKEVARLESELKATCQESRRRKKMIDTQQLLLQASANNYHKCQFCDKTFVNYSCLQAHVQRRHPEITASERQKKRQVEDMEEGIEELRERLRLTQAKLEVEREADTLRKQRELDEQRHKEASVKEQLESWKEEERSKFYQEMSNMKKLIQEVYQNQASENSNIVAKIEDLLSSGVAASNLGTLRDEDERGAREARERELREKIRVCKKKLNDVQNQHLLEKEELQSENERLRSSLSSGQKAALQQVQQRTGSLTTALRQKDALIRSLEEKIKKLSARPVSARLSEMERTSVADVVMGSVPSAAPVVQDKESVEEEEEEEEEELSDRGDLRQRLLVFLKRNPKLVQEFRHITEQTLQEKLESMGLRTGTTGISKQTFKSLRATVAGQRQQKGMELVEMQSLRETLSQEVARRVRRLQKSQGASVPMPATPKGKIHRSPTRKKSSKPRPSPRSPSPRSPSPRLVQPQAPQPAPRTTVQHHTPRSRPQRSSPPFSSGDESVGDSAYITSPGSKAQAAVRTVQPGARQNRADPTEENWSDSEVWDGPYSPGSSRLPRSQESVVQSLAKSLDRAASSPRKKPAGGITVLSAARPSTAAKNQVKEDSDLEWSSIEEITPESSAPRGPGVRGSADSTSAWSSSASRGGVW
ncbi:cilium assembly protein DZIP1L isoform X2 [Amia ocellicauda]|uniref:cilium assembly protein DZIP1L isoform X2 n=1 Tax=Amia ocellicauda TaxID=2972642 RepID=UPI0034641A1E